MSVRFYISCDINIALNHIFGIKKIGLYHYHAYQTLECSTSGCILKTNPPGRESKIWECHAADYAFLPLWYKFEVRTPVLSNLHFA